MALEYGSQVSLSVGSLLLVISSAWSTQTETSLVTVLDGDLLTFRIENTGTSLCASQSSCRHYNRQSLHQTISVLIDDEYVRGFFDHNTGVWQVSVLLQVAPLLLVTLGQAAPAGPVQDTREVEQVDHPAVLLAIDHCSRRPNKNSSSTSEAFSMAICPRYRPSRWMTPRR